MPCAIFYYVTCHNFKPSSAIIVDGGDQYFHKKKFMSKKFHNATCHSLINGWQLITLTLHLGHNYNGVA
jgi:hypothetical protein